MILALQKTILRSNCARLLSIRYVTQLSPLKKIAGIDGKTSLTFMERYQLNEFLKSNSNNWLSQSLKKVTLVNKLGITEIFYVSTTADRAWQCLIKFCIEPVHEAFFHPFNFGFRSCYSIHDLQRYIFLALSNKSLVSQKRVLIIDLENSLSSFDSSYLLKCGLNGILSFRLIICYIVL